MTPLHKYPRTPHVSGSGLQPGDDTAAEALTLAERGGFVRLITDEGAPMALLLAQVRQRGPEAGALSVSAAYLDRLLEVCAAAPGTPAPAAESTAHTLDALSTREQEVLRLLADGLSNAEIAERLVVTPGTVKRHLHNLYSKLGVANRTQAAAFARTHQPPRPNNNTLSLKPIVISYRFDV